MTDQTQPADHTHDAAEPAVTTEQRMANGPVDASGLHTPEGAAVHRLETADHEVDEPSDEQAQAQEERRLQNRDPAEAEAEQAHAEDVRMDGDKSAPEPPMVKGAPILGGLAPADHPHEDAPGEHPAYAGTKPLAAQPPQQIDEDVTAEETAPDMPPAEVHEGPAYEGAKPVGTSLAQPDHPEAAGSPKA